MEATQRFLRFVKSYTGNTASVARFHTLIETVDLSGPVVKIGEPVVRTDSIVMIYFTFRPFTRNIRPCNTMCIIVLSEYTADVIFISIESVETCFASIFCVPTPSMMVSREHRKWSRFPTEYTGVGIVIDQLANQGNFYHHRRRYRYPQELQVCFYR